MAGFEHIFLGNEYHQSKLFTSTQSGRSPHIPRRNNPDQHVQWLTQNLENAWQVAERMGETRQAVSLPTRTGVYLEFRSDTGADLVSKSLEYRPGGIRLLNVRDRKIPGSEDSATYATVYVPASKRGHFHKRMQRYADQNDLTKNGERKHRPLVESIADIALAEVGSFWNDPIGMPGKEPSWCEAWLRTEHGNEQKEIVEFRLVLNHLEIPFTEGVLHFPERSILQIYASIQQINELIDSTDHLAELRRVKDTAAFWIDLDNVDQALAVEDLLGRCTFIDTDTSICILDTGVNRGHPLIAPVLKSEDCHSVNPGWGVSDDHRHGTLMAGVAVYGDLQEALATMNGLQVHHVLESSKILPHPGTKNPTNLYGYQTQQGVSRAEIGAPERRRVICMAVTTTDDLDGGRPSSWSAEIDALASGADADDGFKRLIVVSAGNTMDPQEWRDFPDRTKSNQVHDPGQSWNALTVGAFTHKTMIQDEVFKDFRPVAPVGSISPFTSTSSFWDKKWPTKPDVLFEGGNAAVLEDGSCEAIEDLALLSTHYKHIERMFATHGMTSAATALAARMAARLQAAYPDAWPETIRALIVHSAEWTSEMRRAFLDDESKSSYENLIKICGYGVPDLNRAISCASNSLTLISQRELQPYQCEDGAYKTCDMHLHELPWPSDILLSMGDQEVALRITLSYFIEPGPGEVGWNDRYRYSSHALRFKLNTPNESADEFLIRINKRAREEEQNSETESDSKRWKIGRARNRGSVHSDILVGPAAELAQMSKIGVFPVVGWWRERYYLRKFDKRTRYSLIVSLNTPEQDVDLYTPVATKVGIATPVEISVY